MKKKERATQDYVSDFYEEKRYRLAYSQIYHDWWARTMLSLTPLSGRVLDNGCGTGFMARHINRPNTDVVGIDLSTRMLGHATSRIDNLVCGDSLSLPFRDQSFDVVLGRSLLHHLRDPVVGLQEMARVLRPHGRMIIADTNRSLISALPRWLSKHGRHFSDDHKNLSARQLVRDVTRLFYVEKFVFFGYLAYPLAFPDLFNFGKFLPFPVTLTRFLIRVDQIISHIPLLRTQSWGLMLLAKKRNKLCKLEY